ncbi:F-box domain containing protein [Tanacetum coccineum]|uniref:F-box domain containing protein n=1 Tax=Tanacetum coccineum TaxID=301880 RepID=A0ABQ5EE77_9ASTR
MHPLRKECYELPPLSMRFDKTMLRDSCGLGFDSSTNTLKMVYVLCKSNMVSDNTDVVKKDLCTMVHVLGTNLWREIPQVPSYPITGKAVFVKGCLHWLCLVVMMVERFGGCDDDWCCTLSPFSVAKAWEAIRPCGNQVGWFRIVWFSHNSHRHAFHLWLVMRKGLKTHDKLKQWDVGPTIDPMGSKRTARCIFGKLMAASTYFIWIERNNRTFKNVRRSPEEIRDIIIVTVRHLLSRWKMPKNFCIYG